MKKKSIIIFILFMNQYLFAYEFSSLSTTVAISEALKIQQNLIPGVEFKRVRTQKLNVTLLVSHSSSQSIFSIYDFDIDGTFYIFCYQTEYKSATDLINALIKTYDKNDVKSKILRYTFHYNAELSGCYPADERSLKESVDEYVEGNKQIMSIIK